MLEGTKTVLRALDVEDAERVQRWINTELAGTVGGVPGAFSRKSQEAWIAQMGTNRDPLNRALAVDTIDGRQIGLARVHDIQWVNRRCKLWLLIGEPDYRGRGYEEDVLQLLLQYAFLHLNLNRAELWLTGQQEEMLRAAAGVGFVEEARLMEALFVHGQYVEEVGLRMLARDFFAPPAYSGPKNSDQKKTKAKLQSRHEKTLPTRPQSTDRTGNAQGAAERH